MTDETSTETTEEAVEPRPFATWLLEQAAGRTHDEMSEGLRDLVARVRDTGKKGSITLTVNVGLLDKDPNTLVVKDEIRLKLPEHDRKACLYFPDAHNNLSREDPNQMSIDDLKSVDDE